jgi:O-acetyl-ADP-ribose deacetylase (regulator of RNase III)
MDAKLEAVEGDITQLNVDAIVNAANSTLLGGGGVDGAIHRAAGPALKEECRKLGGCATGDAKITKGHKLKARFVIHAVGPVWHGGGKGEDGLLAGCYRRALDLAAEHGVKTIAFPAISTGAYGFPLARAARIAVAAVRTHAAVSGGALDRVLFVCFGAEALREYRAALSESLHPGGDA